MHKHYLLIDSRDRNYDLYPNSNNYTIDLNNVFKNMDEALVGYKKETGESLKDYLQTFEKHMDSSVNSLGGAIRDLSEIGEIFEDFKNQNK